ncbi:hypothetical protein KEM54_004466 [Ascosphaera aggregata]|nr:hypothetical protein KEM54_004466 [Ascosphaera aggregata]
MGAFTWMIPSGRVSLHHATKTIHLSRRKNVAGVVTSNESSSDNADDGAGSIGLAELCSKTTPKTCRLNPLLFNGHLQTGCTVVYKEDVPVFYKRHVFEADTTINYEGTFAVDFVVLPEQGTGKTTVGSSSSKVGETGDTAASQPTENSRLLGEEGSTTSSSADLPERTTYYTDAEFYQLGSETDTTPMLVVLHGLSGGSHEIYVRHILKPLCYEHGWAACVVNSRGCAQSKITTPMMYNARATWDCRQTVSWLHKMYPKRPLFGIGFSLGANILANYVGEEGDSCLLKSAVYVSNPWNLDAGSLALQRTFIGREAYSRTMGNNMKKLFKTHIDMISKHKRVNVDRIMSVTYLHEFDRELQGPVWGYPTETAYYRDASSSDSIFSMKIPFLVIHAEDDPISQKECLPYGEVKATPYGVMCTSSWGGHLGWFQSGGTRWVTTPVINYLTTLATEIDLDAPIILPKEEEDGLPPTEQPLPDVAEPGTQVREDMARSSGVKVFGGPELTFEPMRRKLAMPHLADKHYS